jgi:hypothetical protein
MPLEREVQSLSKVPEILLNILFYKWIGGWKRNKKNTKYGLKTIFDVLSLKIHIPGV